MILVALGYLLILLVLSPTNEVIVEGLGYFLIITGLATKFSFSKYFVRAAKAYFVSLLLIILEALTYYYLDKTSFMINLIMLITPFIVLSSINGMFNTVKGLKDVETSFNLNFKTSLTLNLVKSYLVVEVAKFIVIFLEGVGISFNLDTFLVFLNYLASGIIVIYLVMLILTVSDFHKLMKDAK